MVEVGPDVDKSRRRDSDRNLHEGRALIRDDPISTDREVGRAPFASACGHVELAAVPRAGDDRSLERVGQLDDKRTTIRDEIRTGRERDRARVPDQGTRSTAPGEPRSTTIAIGASASVATLGSSARTSENPRRVARSASSARITRSSRSAANCPATRVGRPRGRARRVVPSSAGSRDSREGTRPRDGRRCGEGSCRRGLLAW